MFVPKNIAFIVTDTKTTLNISQSNKINNLEKIIVHVFLFGHNKSNII